MLPSIFGESLFDDWFDFPFRGFESDVDHTRSKSDED